jgi:hypothetical protein
LLRRVIARGAASAVYEAEKVVTRRRAAIKLLDIEASERARRRMVGEALTIARLTHRHGPALPARGAPWADGQAAPAARHPGAERARARVARSAEWGRALRRARPETLVVLADPAGSGSPVGSRRGWSAPTAPTRWRGSVRARLANLHREEVIDAAESVGDESFETTRRLIVEEGLLVGGSSGTNVAAALRVARRKEIEGPVVTVLPDSWDRYFATEWMRAWT